MAFARNAGFTSAIATNPADTAAGYLTPDRYNLPFVVSGATSGGIPYFDSATSEASSALLASGGVVLGGGAGAAPNTSANLSFDTSSKRLTVGAAASSPDAIKFGYMAANRAGIWNASITAATFNGVMLGIFGTDVCAPSGREVRIYPNAGSTSETVFSATAGAGPSFAAGTATTDVNALSITRTRNASGVAFKDFRQVITDTASDAGSLDMSLERSTGQGIGVAMLSELTTIAAAATTDTTIQMPANSLVIGVSVRVITVIPTATNFTVGDSGSAARFSTVAVSTAATSTDPGTKAGTYYNATALAVRITPDGTPADNSGRVRVTIHYIKITPPTS